MSIIKKSVEVDATVPDAYRIWTEFEGLTRFLPGVREVRRLGENRLYWRAEVGGSERDWELEITERVPGERLVWHARRGPRTSGSVLFEPLSRWSCRVTFEMRYDPRGFLALAGDSLGVGSRWVARGLKRFRELAEDSGASKLPPVENLVGQ